MPTILHLRNVLVGLGAFGGAAAIYKVFSDSEGGSPQVHLVHASKKIELPQPGKWDYNWDMRHPECLVKPCSPEEENTSSYKEKVDKMKARTVRHLILIRHGQYNLAGAGDKERYLTELGREQADYTGLRLKELGHPYTVIVKSTMTRAIETANIIAKHLPGIPMESSDLLREGAPIPAEPPVSHWKPEARQFYEDGARIEAAFRKYFHRADPTQEKDSYEILVCHANVIRYFVCRALQFPPEAWLRLGLNHASITWVSLYPNGRVVLKAFGDSGHMPPAKITAS